MPRPPVTSAMIAQKLGVSRATVSIVLNGRGDARKLAPATIARVQAAARELGYAPDRAARNLRLRRSGAVGVLLADFRMDWSERVMTGMAEVFDTGSHTALIATHRFDPARHRRELTAAVQRRDEAIIVQPVPGQDELYRQVMRAGVPLVFLGDLPPAPGPVNFAGWDSAAAARTAVEHLIATGRRRIGHLAVEHPLRMTLERTATYRRVLREARLPVDERWIAIPPPGGDVARMLTDVVARLFAPGAERPDALFVLNDGLALTLLEVLDQRGIRVPDDVAVIGMGDLPLTGHRGIGLSTVREPCEEMGRAAARAALTLIADPGRAPLVAPIPGNELKARRTTVGIGR